MEVTDDDIMNLIAEVEMSDLEEVLKEIPVEDLVALAGGVASQVPQSGKSIQRYAHSRPESRFFT